MDGELFQFENEQVVKINAFIKEWEVEKVQLEAEGKRSADFQVKEPYSADVSLGKNNPIYMAHI